MELQKNNSKLKCVKCDYECNTLNGMSNHVTSKHGMSKFDFRVIYCNNGITPPTCECGCGEPVYWHRGRSRFSKYSDVHIKHSNNKKPKKIIGALNEFESTVVKIWNREYDVLNESEKIIHESIQNIRTPYMPNMSVLSNKTYPISTQWEQYHGKKILDAPKTDIISDDMKYRVSIKRGQCQIMSAAKNEAIATFLTSAEKSGLTETATNSVLKLLEQFVSRTSTEIKTISEIIKSPSDVDLSDINKIARQVYANAKQLHNNIHYELNELFDNNEKFKRQFLFEALTGKIKFANSEATANSILMFSKNADAAIFKELYSADCSFIDDILNHIRINVSMKSGSIKPESKKTGYVFYSVLRIKLDDMLSKSAQLKIAPNVPENKYHIMIQKYITGICNKILKTLEYITRYTTQCIRAIKNNQIDIYTMLELIPIFSKSLYKKYDFHKIATHENLNA